MDDVSTSIITVVRPYCSASERSLPIAQKPSRSLFRLANEPHKPLAIFVRCAAIGIRSSRSVNLVRYVELRDRFWPVADRATITHLPVSVRSGQSYYELMFNLAGHLNSVSIVSVPGIRYDATNSIVGQPFSQPQITAIAAGQPFLHWYGRRRVKMIEQDPVAVLSLTSLSDLYSERITSAEVSSSLAGLMPVHPSGSGENLITPSGNSSGQGFN